MVSGLPDRITTALNDNENNETVENVETLSEVDEPIGDVPEEISELETGGTKASFEITSDEEISDKIASEIATEILKELDEVESSPESFLTEDGKTLITLPEYTTNEYKDDSENVVVTSTFASDSNDVEVTSTTDVPSPIDAPETIDKSSVRVNRYIDPRSSRMNSIDNKPVILSANKNVETFFKDLREKLEKGIPPLSIQKEDIVDDLETKDQMLKSNDIETVTENSMNVYELLTTISNVFDAAVDPNEENQIPTTEIPTDSDSVFDVTTFNSAQSLHDTQENEEKQVQTTPFHTETKIATTPMVTLPTTTVLPTTTTVKPRKTFKPNKENSSHSLNFFKDFTEEDIEVLKSLFRSAKKSQRRTKEKRSHPDKFWNELFQKASPRLEALGKLMKAELTTENPESETVTTELPETTTVLSTTTENLVETTVQTVETTTKMDESLSEQLDQSMVMREATEEEPTYNRIDDTLHSKRAAQHLFSSEPEKSPFSSLKEKLNFGSKSADKFNFGSQTPERFNFGSQPPEKLKKPHWLEKLENETSEEREHRLEHDLQKMIKFVGILSKVDGFFMDRTKSAVRKLNLLLDDDDGESHHRQHDRRRKRRNHFYY